MSPLAAFAIYFVIWWTVLFCVLPINVRSQAEQGEITAGTDPGAPASPDLLRKALLTSVLSLPVFAIVWWLWVWAEF